MQVRPIPYSSFLNSTRRQHLSASFNIEGFMAPVLNKCQYILVFGRGNSNNQPLRQLLREVCYDINVHSLHLTLTLLSADSFKYFLSFFCSQLSAEDHPICRPVPM